MKHHRVTEYSTGLLLLMLASAQAGGIYWTDRQSGSRGLRASDLDGTKPVLLTGLQSRTDPRGVAVDAAGGRLYFCDSTSVVSVLFDFPNRTAGPLTAIGSGSGLRDLSLDREMGYLYYADESAGQVGRIALPGAVPDGAAASFPKSLAGAYYLTVSESAGGWVAAAGNWKLFAGNSTASYYVSDGPVGPVAMSALSLPPLNPAPNNIRGVQIDPVTGWIYWCEKDTFRIRRARFDGTTGLTQAQDVYSGLCAPHGLWLDRERGKLYWVDSGTNASGLGKGGINRGDTDGSGPVETLVLQNAGSGQPWDLAVDVTVESFLEWQHLYFRKDAPPSVRAASADPDADHYSNRKEFLLGMNPLLHDSPATEAGIWQDPDDDKVYPTIRFLRRPPAAAVIATPVQSTDLLDWSGEMVMLSSEPADEGMEAVTYRSVLPLSDAPHQFMRVEATGP